MYPSPARDHDEDSYVCDEVPLTREDVTSSESDDERPGNSPYVSVHAGGVEARSSRFLQPSAGLAKARQLGCDAILLPHFRGGSG